MSNNDSQNDFQTIKSHNHTLEHDSQGSEIIDLHKLVAKKSHLSNPSNEKDYSQEENYESDVDGDDDDGDGDDSLKFQNHLEKQPSSNTASKVSSSTDVKSYKLRKTEPYDQLQDVAHKNSRLHRIFSENEKSNFNPVSGRRMYDDDKHRPYKFFSPDSTSRSPININSNNNGSILISDLSMKRQNLNNTSRKFASYSHITPSKTRRRRNTSSFYHSSLLSDRYDDSENKGNDKNNNHLIGMEDEYIPDFDFRSAIQQWITSSYFDDYVGSFESSSVTGGVTPFSRPTTPVGQLHAQVQPVQVPGHQSAIEQTLGQGARLNLNAEEQFVLQSLPDNFRDLPFTKRKKIISELSPYAKEDTISKIVKQKFRRKIKDSPALNFLASFSERSLKETDEGSTVLDHKLGKIIGRGAWGVVRECYGLDNETRAIKIIRAKNDEAKSFFKKETDIWRKLDHSNILRLINVKVGEFAIFCLSSKANGGTLFDLVSRWNIYDHSPAIIEIPERLELSKKYALQVAHALSYMHSIGFVHGDVKLENCLLEFTGHSSKILLIDFGMSIRYMRPAGSDDDILFTPNGVKIKRRPSIPRSISGTSLSGSSPHSLQRIVNEKHKTHDDTKLTVHEIGKTQSPESKKFNPAPFEVQPVLNDDQDLPHSHIGSLPYSSPELLESVPIPLGPSADVWAFGVMLYTMVVGKLPFQHKFEPRLRAMISSGKYDKDSLEKACTLPNGEVNEEILRVVKGCLTLNIIKRLNLDDVIGILEGR
ncbi:hypothetical protein WICMUC_004797 [Wickerhamomyces mucosus]|uniref:Protein kinase domain-containing protein n=1 Tax=Wickerhamomyces mucosus TaxID=1378264 RepID=A0A9P8PEJ9_9ASCO|nr:hypothetical protein WICMUC_004797 [Wickerhamomyces mucosus]